MFSFGFKVLIKVDVINRQHIVKSNKGYIENRVIQLNQDVHVCGMWWIGVYVVANSNSTFALQN